MIDCLYLLPRLLLLNPILQADCRQYQVSTTHRFSLLSHQHYRNCAKARGLRVANFVLFLPYGAKIYICDFCEMQFWYVLLYPAGRNLFCRNRDFVTILCLRLCRRLAYEIRYKLCCKASINSRLGCLNKKSKILTGQPHSLAGTYLRVDQLLILR